MSAGQTSMEEFRRMQAKARSEADFLADIQRLANELGLLFYHTHRSEHSPAGWPDITVAVPADDPRGRRPAVVFAELKREDKDPTDLQWAWIRPLRASAVEGYHAAARLINQPTVRSEAVGLENLNGWCYVWRPSDWDGVIKVLGGLGRHPTSPPAPLHPFGTERGDLLADREGDS